MNGCNQAIITDAAMVNLVGIESLSTIQCSRDVRIAAALLTGAQYESESEYDDESDDEE